MGAERAHRHCNCQTVDLTNSSVQPQTTLLTPNSRQVPHQCKTSEASHWRSFSHHNAWNASHSLNFGPNCRNTCFATPGESLNMLQLGTAKQAVKSFAQMVSSLPQNNVGQRGCCPAHGNRAKAFANFSKVAVDCGHFCPTNQTTVFQCCTSHWKF